MVGVWLFSTRSRVRIAAVVFAWLGGATFAGTARSARAITVVLAGPSCPNDPPGRVGQWWDTLKQDLERRGAKVVDREAYLRTVVGTGVRPRAWFRRAGIRRVARAMPFDILITSGCRTQSSRRSGPGLPPEVCFHVLSSTGRPLREKPWRLSASELVASQARVLAGVVAEIGDLDPVIEPLLTSRAIAPGAGLTAESLLDAPHQLVGGKTRAENIFVAADVTALTRTGLRPTHEMSRPIPGARLAGRVFLGSFLDLPLLSDIGLGGSYQQSFSARYRLEDADGAHRAVHAQWTGELLGRLTFDQAALRPVFLLRFGYGSVWAVIPKKDPAMLSVAYFFPYGAGEIQLMLAEPVIRAVVAGGHIFAVQMRGDLSGRGTGFLLRAGLEAEPFANLLVGVGYDITRFVINDKTRGEMPDRYDLLSFRVGWSY